MTTYRGPARVIVDDGEHVVDVDLALTVSRVPVPGHPGQTMPGLSEWGGTVHTRDDGAAWSIFDAEDPRLRIDGDEREGHFITTQHTAGSDVIKIKGSGAAPF